MDKYFRIEVLVKTPDPQTTVYEAMHQDYSEEMVIEEIESFPSEEKAGEIIVKKLLAGDRGHYGPFEHPQIVFSCGYFPHSVMQQLRTHRGGISGGISFDVQSNRYTGQRIIDVVTGKRDTEEVFYLRPVGEYSDRQGKRYHYSEKQRDAHLEWCFDAADQYQQDIESGLSEEHARGLIPFDVRQHFVLSLNARQLMHILDMRWKKDAQLECQWFCDLLFPHFENWMPAVAKWYEENRGKKARLAP